MTTGIPFREFRRLCSSIANESSYISKTRLIKTFLNERCRKDEIYSVIKMLLPKIDKTVYNLSDKKIIKIFSRLLECDEEAMKEDLDKGHLYETVKTFFQKSKTYTPIPKSVITIQDVEEFLTGLSRVNKEKDQITHLKDILLRCTANDLKCLIMLIKHDLKINSGTKHVLDALDSKAYDCFKSSRDLKRVVEKFVETESVPVVTESFVATPIEPTLATPCKSLDKLIEKCKNGMFVETKYDGERVQVHKNGNEFTFFSRTLKPITRHDVDSVSSFIVEAFPSVDTMILDSEMVLMDGVDDKPLPFGTLGVHKRKEYQKSSVCLFIFDCLYFNGVSLLETPLCERKKILYDNIKVVRNRIMLVDTAIVTDRESLEKEVKKSIDQELEGLMVKDVYGKYEPGKRRWFKIKRDHLEGGSMADSVDLAVIGGFYGRGGKGGIISSFLMCCYNKLNSKWYTVTRCSNGHDDKTLKLLQKTTNMIKIGRDPAKIPGWLVINKIHYPDFIVSDPTKASVWEITGSGFTKSKTHTAGNISVRFPRCTRIRSDKTWKQVTDLSQLKELMERR